MLRSRLDRAFTRFADTGDPKALARVFDGCAAELYRLAHHLIGDRHTAEDLVQQTFVVAIEQAASFDRSRGVLPWLCGILTHRALHLRRQLRQRAARVPLPQPDLVDPAHEAEARETATRVAEAVRALPEPYRQVLLLHLVHELSGKDIAEALARPEATVRTQLARGLDKLRKVLPAGIGGSAFGCVPPPLGLGAVRAAVLERAAQTIPTTTTALGLWAGAVTGVLLMQKLMLLAVAACLALAAWHWWPAPPAPPMAVGQDPARAGVPSALQAAELPQPLPTGEETGREPAPPIVDASTTGLEVVVQWPDGAPAADIAVRCRPRPLEFEAWLRTARTGEDGKAKLVGLPPGPANVLTGRGIAADVDLLAGHQQSLTITLPRGVDVRGRVVDADERPVAGATIWLSVCDNSDDCEPVAVSDAQGSFTIRGAGPGGNLMATSDGLGCAKVTRVKEEVVLTMRPAPGTLLGTVVDAAGQPVADARVLLGVTMQADGGLHRRLLGEIQGQDLWPSRFLRTDTEGRFRSEGLPALPWPLWVGAPGFAPSWQTVHLAAGTPTEVSIRLTEGATLRGRITDAAGASVAGAQVAACPILAPPHPSVGLGMSLFTAPPLWGRRSTTTDAQGEYLLAQVMPGTMQLLAHRRDASVAIQRELADGESLVWDAVLAGEPTASAALHGTLVDEAGEAMQGWKVLVDRPEPEHDGNWILVREGGGFRTNRVPPGAHRLFAKPHTPLLGDAVDLGLHEAANSPLRLVIPSARVPKGRLRGRIVSDAALPPASAWVLVTRLPGREQVRVRCDAEGRYAAGPLQVGEYRLRVEAAGGSEFAIGTFAVPTDADTDAGTFSLPPTGTLVVTLVDTAGQRLFDGWVLVRPVGDDDRGGRLAHQEGRASGPLPPGRWRIETRDATTLAAIEVDVLAGRTTDVQMVVPTGVPYLVRVPQGMSQHGILRLRQQAVGGSLLRDSPLHPHEAGKDVPFAAPPGRYVLTVQADDGTSATTTFDLRSGGPTQVVDLPLPGG
jgi:RNA polymerase sigma-70 factor (ECF subfamily)